MQGRSMSPERMSFFSDAVLAVVITIMVLAFALICAALMLYVRPEARS